MATTGTEPSERFWRNRPVVVTGGLGFLGKPVVARLKDLGANVSTPRSADLDLRDPAQARRAVDGASVVFHLAARVGGISYNRSNPAPCLYDNLVMACNIFEQSRVARVDKLVAASSVCAYPKNAHLPFREDDVWDGYPEESNGPYGIAKRMLLEFSRSYREQYEFLSCAPILANLYGPGDNYSLEDSHVLAGMVRRFNEAVALGDGTVTLWGSGLPSREFLYVDDAARAMLLAAERVDTSEPMNIGTGTETTIRDLAEKVAAQSGFTGEVLWDRSRPDGQLRRNLDTSRAQELMGFEARVTLDDGIRKTVRDYQRALQLGTIS